MRGEDRRGQDVRAVRPAVAAVPGGAAPRAATRGVDAREAGDAGAPLEPARAVVGDVEQVDGPALGEPPVRDELDRHAQHGPLRRATSRGLRAGSCIERRLGRRRMLAQHRQRDGRLSRRERLAPGARAAEGAQRSATTEERADEAGGRQTRDEGA